MGANSSKAAVTNPLPSAPIPIGVNGFYTQHKEELALQVCTMCRDGFIVVDASTARTVFRVETSADKQVIQDAVGNDLITLRKDPARSISVGYDARMNEDVFAIHDQTTWKRFKLLVIFRNIVGTGSVPITLVLRSESFQRTAEVKLYSSTGAIVARFTPSQWQGSQTHVVRVAPGVDASLMLAVFVYLDQKVRHYNGTTVSSHTRASLRPSDPFESGMKSHSTGASFSVFGGDSSSSGGGTCRGGSSRRGGGGRIGGGVGGGGC